MHCRCERGNFKDLGGKMGRGEESKEDEEGL